VDVLIEAKTEIEDGPQSLAGGGLMQLY